MLSLMARYRLLEPHPAYSNWRGSTLLELILSRYPWSICTVLSAYILAFCNILWCRLILHEHAVLFISCLKYLWLIAENMGYFFHLDSTLLPINIILVVAVISCLIIFQLVYIFVPSLLSTFIGMFYGSYSVVYPMSCIFRVNNYTIYMKSLYVHK